MARKRKPVARQYALKQYALPIYRSEMVGTLDIYAYEGRIEDGIAALKSEGLELVTARELAEARIFCGAKHPISQENAWVAEHFIYTPHGKNEVLVVDRAHSLFLQSPEKAAAAMRAPAGFPLDADKVKELREMATADGRYGVLLLPNVRYKSHCHEIPPRALAKNPCASFLFKDLAGPYGQFLEEQGVKEVTLLLPCPEGCFGFSAEGPYGSAINVHRCVNLNEEAYGTSAIFDDDLQENLGLAHGVRHTFARHTMPETDLEAGILQALRQGRKFKYGGLTYTPVKEKPR